MYHVMCNAHESFGWLGQMSHVHYIWQCLMSFSYRWLDLKAPYILEPNLFCGEIILNLNAYQSVEEVNWTTSYIMLSICLKLVLNKIVNIKMINIFSTTMSNVIFLLTAKAQDSKHVWNQTFYMLKLS